MNTASTMMVWIAIVSFPIASHMLAGTNAVLPKTQSREPNLPKKDSYALKIHLRDGSQVIGATTIPSFQLKTAFGKVELSLSLIRTVEFPLTQSNAVVNCVNGDRLTGGIMTSEVAMQTSFADIKIPLSSISKIDVRDEEAGQARLILHYSFDRDDGNRVVDSSGNGCHGEFHGIPRRQQGKIGTGLSFGGSEGDYVSCTGSESITIGSGSFSVACWIRARTQDSILLSKHRSQANQSNKPGWNLHLENGPTPAWLPGILLDISDGNRSTQDTLISAEATDGEWHHIAVIVDRASGVACGYLDGVAARSMDISHIQSASNDEPLYVGWRGDWENYRGSLDELRIYNGVLQPEEVLRLARSPLSGGSAENRP